MYGSLFMPSFLSDKRPMGVHTCTCTERNFLSLFTWTSNMAVGTWRLLTLPTLPYRNLMETSPLSSHLLKDLRLLFPAPRDPSTKPCSPVTSRIPKKPNTNITFTTFFVLQKPCLVRPSPVLYLRYLPIQAPTDYLGRQKSKSP